MKSQHVFDSLVVPERRVTILRRKHVDLIAFVLTFGHWMHMPMGIDPAVCRCPLHAEMHSLPDLGRRIKY
jgi:hypothetical protein